MTTHGTVRTAGNAGTARTPGTARGRTTCTDRQGAGAFTAYVKARGPVLLRTARSLTADPRDAEDLLQTALAKTYLAWERIEDHRALDGYVRTALLNTRTSLWRKRRIAEFVHGELPEPHHGHSPDPAETLALRDAVWRAVLALPERQRAMVVLRFYEDLSEKDTAAVLGVSAGTVKSTVSRALAKLRRDAQLASVVRGTDTRPPAAGAALAAA